MVAFCSDIVSIFKIGSVLQARRKEIKFYMHLANKEREQLQLTLDNSKSEEGQGNN